MGEETVRRIYLPYCLERLEDGRHIVLNRLYKPLGVANREWVDYALHPSAVYISGLTMTKIKSLSHKGSEDINHIHLYDDHCVPTHGFQQWVAYSKRLMLLADLRIALSL